MGGTLPLGYTGATNLTTAGTTATTAGDWTDSNGTASRGADYGDVSRWWMSASGSALVNAGTERHYCVEE